MADINVANADADLSGKTLLTAENPYTVTGLHTFSRGASAPFAVVAGGATVANLDAAKLNAQGPNYYTDEAKWFSVVKTDVGTQNNYAPGFTNNSHLLVRCNNASLLTITGIAGGVAGQKITFFAVNAQVDFVHNSVSSAAANRLLNVATTGNTSIAGGTSGYGGSVTYIYDTTAASWVLIRHEQGGWITPAFAAGNYTANGTMTWTLDAGDVTVNKYRLAGRTLFWQLTLAATTVGGVLNTQLRAALPGGFTALATGPVVFPCQNSDNGANFVLSVAQISASQAYIEFYVAPTQVGNWTAATNTTQIRANVTIEVS